MKAEEMLWMSDACVTMTQSRFLRFLLLISSFSSFIATTVRLASCAAAAAAVVVVASSGHALCSTGRGCRSIRSILYAYASLCVCVCVPSAIHSVSPLIASLFLSCRPVILFLLVCRRLV